MRAHEAGSWVQLGVTRHDDGSLTIPVIPGRHAENGDDGVAPTPGPTGMTIRPGEGGYVEALAQVGNQPFRSTIRSVGTIEKKHTVPDADTGAITAFATVAPAP